MDGCADGAGTTRPNAAPIFPSAPSATRRARRQCMEVAPCTEECVRCRNHTNRTGAYGVIVYCWCEWGEPGAAAPGYDVFQHVQDGLMVPRMGARSGPPGRLIEAQRLR